MTILADVERQLNGKTAIVSGCNQGIGYAIAEELARRGVRLIMACRNQGRADEARAKLVETTSNEQIIVKVVDISSLESVREFAEDISKNEERVDLLICNAGIILNGPMEKSVDGFELQFAANYLGHFLLCQLLLPLLKRSAPSRIIHMSSGAQKYASLDFDNLYSQKSYKSSLMGVYAVTKFYQVLCTIEQQQRFEADGISCFAVDPGAVRTNVARHLCIIRFLHAVCSCMFSTPEKGAETAVYCCLMDDELAKTLSGSYLVNGVVRERDLNGEARGEKGVENAKKLWTVTEELLVDKGFLPNGNE